MLASKTTLMMDWGGMAAGVSLSALSPTPRPMASAATAARSTKHGQDGRFACCFLSSSLVVASGADGVAEVGARTVRPEEESVVFLPAVTDTTTGLSPAGSNSSFSEEEEDAIWDALRIGKGRKGRDSGRGPG